MYEAIKQLAQKYHQETINQRRDFHHFAERGWLEIRTACQIATTLENLGYEVLVGKEIMDKDARMGLPPEAIFNINYLRAKKEGANPKYLEQVKNGMTAVAGILKNGVGPVVAIRFDIDALEKKEHFKNLCKMGLTNQDVKKISYKEGNGFYVVLWIFAGIYILSIACTFLIRASINLGLVGIVLLEFVVPYGMAELIVYLKKRGQNYELHGN